MISSVRRRNLSDVAHTRTCGNQSTWSRDHWAENCWTSAGGGAAAACRASRSGPSRARHRSHRGAAGGQRDCGSLGSSAAELSTAAADCREENGEARACRFVGGLLKASQSWDKAVWSGMRCQRGMCLTRTRGKWFPSVDWERYHGFGGKGKEVLTGHAEVMRRRLWKRGGIPSRSCQCLESSRPLWW